MEGQGLVAEKRGASMGTYHSRNGSPSSTATLDEITAIANNRRLKPGPKAGLIWAKVNCARPPTGMQLSNEMGVCRNTAESWLRAWEHHGYLLRLPSHKADGMWRWRRQFTDAQNVSTGEADASSQVRDISPGHTDAQKVSIKGRAIAIARATAKEGRQLPSEDRRSREDIAMNAQKV
jgi:hypothetical protein